MNFCNLTIVFEFGEVNNKYMTVFLEHNNKIVSITPSDSSLVEFNKKIELPTQLHLKFKGKNNSNDTIIDDKGNIVKDKHVLIKQILLDNIAVEPLYLTRQLKLQHQNQIVQSNYVGFNGTMSIDLARSNVFFQLMDWKRLGEN
jgi:hypothetical protein